MCNELIWIISLLLSFVLIIFAYKKFGKTGLFLWTAVITIISNIQTVKLIEIFGLETSLGNILYGTTFLATDILNLKYGEKAAKESIKYGFISMILMTLFMAITLLYSPSTNDFANESLKIIFSFNIRITLASIAAYLVSQLVDARLFNYLHTKYNKIWLSNNLSTMVSQILDTLIFVIITYIGIVPINAVVKLMISMYIFKFIVALCDTPFIYIANRINRNEEK